MYSPLVRIALASAVSLAALAMISCGGSSNRMLESISVSPQVGNGQVQFVATGTFSAPPTKVTPLSVNWSVPPLAISVVLPTITSQGVASCGASPISVKL